MDYAINTNGFNGQIIQTEDHEIRYQDCIKKMIAFFLWFNRKKLWLKLII